MVQKCCIEEEVMSEKTPRGMSGSKIGDSLTKNHSFVPLCKEVLRGVELMGRRAEDADEPTKAD